MGDAKMVAATENGDEKGRHSFNGKKLLFLFNVRYRRTVSVLVCVVLFNLWTTMSSSNNSNSSPIQEVLVNPETTNTKRRIDNNNNAANNGRQDQLPTLLITGILRNGNEWIETVLRKALKFCKQGVERDILGSCRVLIYENGSTDGTRNKLRQLVPVLPGLTVLLGNDPPLLRRKLFSSIVRTERIAYARNALLEHVLSLQQKMSISHMAVMDLDGAFNMEPASELLEAFHYTSNWDVLSFDATVYYDYWALRCAASQENELRAHQNCNYPPDQGNHTCKQCFFDECFFSKLRKSSKTSSTNSPFENLVPVESAFNGLAFYKMDAIGECRYASTSSSPTAKRWFGSSPDCEHVAFHQCIGDHGQRVMVAPVKQIVNTIQGGSDLKAHIAYTTREDDRCHVMEKKV
jgi:hypothetical protein